MVLRSSILPAALGLFSGAMLTLTATMGGSTDYASAADLLEARRTIRNLQQQLQSQRRLLQQQQQQQQQQHQHQQQQQQQTATKIDGGDGTSMSAAVHTHNEVSTQQRWDDTSDNRRLHDLLTKKANGRGEVMLALANDVMMCSNHRTCWWNGGNILETFLKGLQRIPVANVVIITLDDATHTFCTEFGAGTETAPACLRLNMPVPTAQQGSRGANMISTLKYGLLRQALLMGFAILVVDLDLLFFKDPFEHLYRDADVEASTDGFTQSWAGGQIQSVHDPKMGWGAGGLYIQHFTLNVGCAYFRPTELAIELLRRVAAQLARASAWDQQVFNSEAFMLSHGSYNGSKVGVRVMHYLEWANSKVFFYSARSHFFPGKPVRGPADLPVMVHMNYHPDKHKRMLCVWARYAEGKANACDDMPPASK